MKEDNALIAEFMGLMVFQTENEMREFPIEKLTQWVLPEQCKYHESWEWLMPVVEFLHEPIVLDGRICRSGVEITIYYKACQLKFEPDEDFEDSEEFEIHTQGETKIEAVYKAVVAFIKWYKKP